MQGDRAGRFACPRICRGLVMLLLSFAVLLSWSTISAAEPSTRPGSQAKLPQRETKTQRVYFGGYTAGSGEGIYLADYDARTGAVTNLRLAAKTPNPSFLAIHPSKKLLYAVSEITNFDGKKTGAVAAFTINASDGTLGLINRKPSGGAGPCHVSLDPQGKHAFAANYAGGSAACLPILSDGSLGDPSSVVQHEGSSVNGRRQKSAHSPFHQSRPDRQIRAGRRSRHGQDDDLPACGREAHVE